MNPILIHLGCISMALLIQYTRLPLQPGPPHLALTPALKRTQIASFLFITACLLMEGMKIKMLELSFTSPESLSDFFRPRLELHLLESLHSQMVSTRSEQNQHKLIE